MLRSIVLTVLLVALPSAARAAAPDYAGYQAILNRYVMPADPAVRDGDTRFDYEAFHVSERIWQVHRSKQLEQVHAELFAVRPSQLSPADRAAWAINTYNFLVIERATLRLLVPGKRFVRFRKVDEMRSPDGAFFDAPVGEIEGRNCSLAEFERRYVDEDTTNMLLNRARGADPRRSLALCSGHLGDPPIGPRAFRGDSLEVQLDAATRRALALPRFVRWHEDTHRLDVSDYLARRAIDFGGSLDAIVPFVERYGPNDARKGIRKYKITQLGAALPIDPGLNQWPHPRAAVPSTTPGTD